MVLRVGVITSAEPTFLAKLLWGAALHATDWEFALVVFPVECPGLKEVAAGMDIESASIDGHYGSDRSSVSRIVQSKLESRGLTVALLARYLRPLDPALLSAHVVNTHGSLLPAFGGKGFYGQVLHEQVIASGVRQSGATLHEITAEYDVGPMLAQRQVMVAADDSAQSLREKVEQAEIDNIIEYFNARAASKN